MQPDAEYFTADLRGRIATRADAIRQRIGRLVRFHTLYQRLFYGPDGAISETGQAVLRDLAAFCGADGSIYRPDARDHARLEGRREVFLYIARGLRFDHQQISNLKAQMEELDDD